MLSRFATGLDGEETREGGVEIHTKRDKCFVKCSS